MSAKIHYINQRGAKPQAGQQPSVDSDDVQNAAGAAQTAHESSVMEKVGNATGGALNVGMFVAGFGHIIAGLLGSASKGVEWFGDRTGIDFIKKAGKKTGGFVEAVNSKTVEELMPRNNFTNTVGKELNSAAKFTGKKFNEATNVTRLGYVASEVNSRSAVKHFTNATELLGKFREYGELPTTLQPYANELKGILSQAEIGKVDAKKFAAAKTAFDGELERLVSGGYDTSSRQKVVLNKFGNAINTAEKAVGKHANALGWKSGKLGKSIASLPKQMYKAPVLTTAMNASFIAASAMEVFGEAKGFTANLNALKQMNKDITGKDASTAAVLFGSVSKPVAEARSKLLKSFVVSEGAGLAALGVNIAFAIRGKMSMLGFMAPHAAATGLNALVGETVLSNYDALKKAQAAGQAIPADAYAEFITKAAGSKQLASVKGGYESVKKLATQYAEQKVAPGQIMREVADGSIFKKLDSLAVAGGLAVGGQKLAGNQAKQAYSHVAALRGNNNQQQKQVVGDHTASLVSNSAGANKALELGA